MKTYPLFSLQETVYIAHFLQARVVSVIQVFFYKTNLHHFEPS